MNKIKRTKEDWVVDIFVHGILLVVFFACLYPFYLSIVLSLNEGVDASAGGIYFWPRKFTLDNFSAFLRDKSWTDALLITVSRTVLGTFITVFVTTMVAYGLSIKDLVFRKIYIGLFVFAMYFHGGIIPYFIVLRSLGLLNNFAVYIIPGALSLFFVLVSISFFQSIPSEIAESARLDGAGELLIFLRIILRISTPLLATIAIFSAVGQWNSWFDTAFFAMGNKKIRTMGYMLMTVINKTIGRTNMSLDAASQAGSNVTSLSVQLAAMLIAVFPILTVYPFFQKYFISGLTLGSVKG